MLIIIVSFFCIVLGCCASTFLVPFLLELSKYCVWTVCSHFSRDGGYDSVGTTLSDIDKRINIDIPARFPIDMGLVVFLVGKGFAESDVVFFLEHNQLPDDLVAGIKSGSDNKLCEFRKVFDEYFFERTRRKLLGLHCV